MLTASPPWPLPPRLQRLLHVHSCQEQHVHLPDPHSGSSWCSCLGVPNHSWKGPGKNSALSPPGSCIHGSTAERVGQKASEPAHSFISGPLLPDSLHHLLGGLLTPFEVLLMRLPCIALGSFAQRSPADSQLQVTETQQRRPEQAGVYPLVQQDARRRQPRPGATAL